MTQIFSPAADTWLRLFVLGALAVTGGGTVLAIGFARSDYYTSARLGIDCRYCHSSVEEGPRAGLPPTHTCMTCHSQVWTNAAMLAPVRQSLAENKSLVWQRVARLPEYVYFRHDIHIAKGVGCEACHGRVDQMALTYRAVPLTMEFCIDCHRDPAPHLRPLDHVTDMGWKPDPVRGRDLVKQYGIRLGETTYCYVCHR